jgi:phosphate transport system substrate-binding protein
MKKFLAAVLTVLATSVSAIEITGAGATFPYPIYSKWAEDYQRATGVKLNYQSIGSSGGVKQIKSATVHFGATDAPLKVEDLAVAGLIQFPTVLGGVVPIVNLDGFKPGELQITGPVLAEVFMGTINKWNDPKLTALNPGKKLPDLPITVVHRADGSGTTFIFTDYLNDVSREWAERMGKGPAVKWIPATAVGGKGNEGVAAVATRVKGSVGYVEYAYAKKNNIPHMKMQNRDGRYVDPDDTTFAAAAAGAEWFKTPGMGISLVNQKGANSWPITGATFVLVYREPRDPKATQEVLKFFAYAWDKGGKSALDLDYVPLPKAVTDRIRSEQWILIKK